MIAVVGAGLTGLATAARLARLGHEVRLVERHPVPPALLPSPLDPDPHAVVLPAAWRDLFKKTGRTLDAELSRRGFSLVPAPPRRYDTGQGTLALPHDRAGQWHTLEAALGLAAATAWRELLDRLDTTWLTLRPLGVEAEFSGLDRASRARLRPAETIADLAAGLPPELGGIVTALARRRDSDPTRTPGWLATRLSVERTFGVWQLAATDGTVLLARTLVELLLERLSERGVDLRLGCEAQRAASRFLDTDAGGMHPDATVLALNPWSASALVGGDRILTRTTRRLTPAATAGPRWQGWRTLLELPGLATGTPQVYTASAFSHAGPEPWAQLLTGALVAYRVHHDLTGEDARPANKEFRLPPLRRGR